VCLRGNRYQGYRILVRRRSHKFREKQRAISTPHKSWPNGHRRSRSFSSRRIATKCADEVQRALEFQLTSSLSLFLFFSLPDGPRDPVFRPMRHTRCPTRANESFVYLQDKDSLYTEELQMDDVENCFSRLLSQKAFEISFSSALRYASCNDINLYTLVFVCRKHFSVS